MRVGGRVWLDCDNNRSLGGGRIELLRRVASCGSINQAAKALKMSYKTAWDSIDAMNNLAAEPLVERVSGGSHGGGTKLTKAGESLIALFDSLESKHKKLLNMLSKNGGDADALLQTAQRITMKTSARNQLIGRVAEIKMCAVDCEIVLELRGGARIAATITNDGAEEMGLKIGDEAYALIKASWVILAKEKPERISARNKLEGTVAKIAIGAVNCEVKLEIDGGAIITAIITRESAEELNFAVGDRAWALIKASHIIIGA